MSELTVSVVIPTYNRAHLLGRAVTSALSQLSYDDELIIVDDGSTDNTNEVVGAFPDPRIRYIRQTNAGAGAARNRGVAAATRDLIAFLDSDDEWLAGKLALQRKFMEERTEILFCFTDLGRDYNGERHALLRDGLWHSDLRDWDKILAPPRRYSWYAGLPSGSPDFNVYTGNLYYGLMYYSYFSIICTVIRREEAAGALRFTEGIATYEEWECMGRLAQTRQGCLPGLYRSAAAQTLRDACYGCRLGPTRGVAPDDAQKRVGIRPRIPEEVWRAIPGSGARPEAGPNPRHDRARPAARGPRGNSQADGRSARLPIRGSGTVGVYECAGVVAAYVAPTG